MATITGNLLQGTKLNKGDEVVSNNGQFHLVLQALDGNLVLYDILRGEVGDPKAATWSSKTADQGVQDVQLDQGNLSLTTGGLGGLRVVKQSNSHGADNSFLAVQDDGNVVIYSPI